MEESVLRPWGIALMLFGGTALLCLWFFIPLAPPSTAMDTLPYGGAAAIAEQTQAIQAHTRNLYFRQEYWWLADLMLKGGFFMWLTGLLSDRISARNSEPEE